MVIIKCGRTNLYAKLCEEKRIVQEEVIINNAVGNPQNNQKSYLTEIEIVAIILLLLIIIYIGYKYLKNRFSHNISEELTRQASA